MEGRVDFYIMLVALGIKGCSKVCAEIWSLDDVRQCHFLKHMVNGREVLQALFGPKDWDSPQWYWLPGDGHELSWRSSYACGDWSLLHCPCISRNGRNCDEQHSQHFLHLPPPLLSIVPLTSLGHHLLLSAWFPSIETILITTYASSASSLCHLIHYRSYV